MQVVTKALSELHKIEKNIRGHSERQIREYIRSLEMFGQIRPMVVTEDGEILVGNGMYDALSAMGRTEGDVYVVTGLSAAQKKKLMLADNKVYELGFTDTGVLDDLLADLDGDFDIPGYDPDLLDMLVKSPAEISEVAKDYGTPVPVLTGEVSHETVQHKDEPNQTYSVPVRAENGAFVNPETKEDERRYILCPHCGGKIWL